MPSDANASCYVLAIAGIVDALIAAYEEQEPVNMTRLKNDVAKQFRLPSMPKLVDIISAVPEDYKEKLLPFLKAKPVRTASGIAVVVRFTGFGTWLLYWFNLSLFILMQTYFG
ncbi:hypothetical protein JG688_00000942 [Phytophthora aleatoria]|uniref:ELP3-like N-terminal domain-containing protein n=1 Tax=Phytophthora aleatoria TaxID=2496075 RepID=A0A8J5IYA9_9STRA|nr:hypothetical protein JG688_00000942 [Phytophthora aleatoria]